VTPNPYQPPNIPPDRKGPNVAVRLLSEFAKYFAGGLIGLGIVAGVIAVVRFLMP
jgi:hypothetical protein